MVDRNKFINIVLNEIGYKEKASNAYLDDKEANAGSNNWTKYAALLDSIPDFYNGQKNGPWGEWCDMFYDACMAMAYGPQLAKKLICQPDRSAGAGCEHSAQYYKNAGRWFPSPEVGDQIFFNYGSGIAHTGVVVAVTNSNVITVEGNSNNMVQQCQYSLGSSFIAGYGRPCWELYTEDGSESIPAEDPVEEPVQEEFCSVHLELPVLRLGSLSWHVAVLQILLIGRGYSVGLSGADGDFGVQTQQGLRAFQSDQGLEPNCICAEGTWKKLLEV